MQNKLPNIFIEQSFGIYSTKRTASDQIEYVPKERLDLAVKALKDHKNFMLKCEMAAFSNMEGADGKEFQYWQSWMLECSDRKREIIKTIKELGE